MGMVSKGTLPSSLLLLVFEIEAATTARQTSSNNLARLDLNKSSSQQMLAPALAAWCTHLGATSTSSASAEDFWKTFKLSGMVGSTCSEIQNSECLPTRLIPTYIYIGYNRLVEYGWNRCIYLPTDWNLECHPCTQSKLSNYDANALLGWTTSHFCRPFS